MLAKNFDNAIRQGKRLRWLKLSIKFEYFPIAGNRKIAQSGEAWRNVLMMLTDIDVIRVSETDEELLIFDVSDDALERAAGAPGIADGRIYSTECVGGCACKDDLFDYILPLPVPHSLGSAAVHESIAAGARSVSAAVPPPLAPPTPQPVTRLCSSAS